MSEIWTCNKCKSVETIIMNGKCVFCYGGDSDAS